MIIVIEKLWQILICIWKLISYNWLTQLISGAIIIFLFKKIWNCASKNISKRNENKNSNEEFKKFQTFLEKRDFLIEHVSDKITNKKSALIVWPIKKQKKSTYIHIAQIQLIKQLLKIDTKRKLLVIIGDLNDSNMDNSAIKFKSEIMELLSKNGVPHKKKNILLLSDCCKNNWYKKGIIKPLFENFRLISEISWPDYIKFITHKYSQNTKLEVEKRPIIKNLQPLLKWTMIYTISNKHNVIVVAGADERYQWENLQKKLESKKIGFIYIPALKEEDGSFMDQTKIDINSKTEMKNKLCSGNMAQWLLINFVELYNYPNLQRNSFCDGLPTGSCTNDKRNCFKCLFDNNCGNFYKSEFNKDEFVEYVYHNANPANI